MKNKIKAGHLFINIDTCPDKKADFEKKFKNRVPNLEKAWKEVSSKLKKKV